MTCDIGGYKYTNTNVLIVSGKILEPFGGRFTWFSVIWVLCAKSVAESCQRSYICFKMVAIRQLLMSLRIQKGLLGLLWASLV